MLGTVISQYDTFIASAISKIYFEAQLMSYSDAVSFFLSLHFTKYHPFRYRIASPIRDIAR